MYRFSEYLYLFSYLCVPACTVASCQIFCLLQERPVASSLKIHFPWITCAICCMSCTFDSELAFGIERIFVAKWNQWNWTEGKFVEWWHWNQNWIKHHMSKIWILLKMNLHFWIARLGDTSMAVHAGMKSGNCKDQNQVTQWTYTSLSKESDVHSTGHSGFLIFTDQIRIYWLLSDTY